MASALQDLCNARVGSLLKGKWRLERVLGVGGMAAVYEGVHHIGRKDAIKILHPDVARQPDLKRRFEVEASATNRFRHKGAVEIRDFDVSEDGCPFMVMEMLDGESLGERVRRTGEIAEAELLRYVDQLLDVLVAAHREGIVHRDIKLDNVFITREDEVKVLDFGVARILSGPVQTIAGTRLGTPAYMPPEQLRGLEVDGRADVFAVGATMFRLLTKRRIHEAPTEGQLILKMSTEPAPRTRSVAPGVSENVALVIDRALSFLASARYQNATTMQEDVRAVIAGGPPPYASARARAELDASAPGAAMADRPTVAERPTAGPHGTMRPPAALALEPTGVTVHHGPGAALAPGPPSSSAAVALGPASSSAAVAPGPASSSAALATDARGPASSEVPARSVVSAPSGIARPADRHRGALIPILVVTGITVAIGIVGLALYLHASSSEAAERAAQPADTASAEDASSAAPSAAPDSSVLAAAAPAAPPGEVASGEAVASAAGSAAPTATPTYGPSTPVRLPPLKLPPGKKPKRPK